MKKYNITQASLTVLDMWRSYLITKETMLKYYKKEFYNDEGFQQTTKASCQWNPDTKIWKKSVHEDLDSFHNNIKMGKIQEIKMVTHFSPKLTQEELKLVEATDSEYLKSRDRKFTIYYCVHSIDSIPLFPCK